MEKQETTSFFSQHKVAIGCVVFCLWLFVIINNRMSATTDGHEKNDAMREEIAALLSQGGEVVSQYKSPVSVRGGVLGECLSAASWNDDLLEKYRRTLSERGWKNIGGKRVLRYCKEGMMTEIGLDAAQIDGIKCNEIAISYLQATIHECNQKQ